MRLEKRIGVKRKIDGTKVQQEKAREDIRIGGYSIDRGIVKGKEETRGGRTGETKENRRKWERARGNGRKRGETRGDGG
jgi:hypothetical protein